MYQFSKYKAQYRSNLMLALPVVIAQLGQILVQLADNIMVGSYGGDDPLPLASVAFGGAVFFILFVASIGLTLGLTPLVGELFAQKDRRISSIYLQNGIIFYTLIGILGSAVQLSFIPLMHHFGQPAEVVEMAIPYYRMLALSLPFVLLFYAFKQFLEGVGNTRVEMVITVLCNLTNVGFNWLFIYGNLGFSEMGTEGAGLGTLLSRMLMPTMVIIYFCRHRVYKQYLRGFSLRKFSAPAVRRLLQMGIPISMQMFLESSAFIGTGIMMGWFGTTTIGGHQISNTMSNCAFMVVLSIGAATTIRVSHCFGQRDFNQAALAAKASLHLALAWNTITALGFILLRNHIPLLFTTNPEVIDMASKLLVFVALFQLSDGVQNVAVGILRGIQDVRAIMPIAFISYWILNLPVGYLLGFKLGMGPEGLILGFTFGLSCAAILLLLRIRRSMRKLKNG